MFHTYVLPYCHPERPRGQKTIDIDRASFLMDKDLLEQSIKAMEYERDNDPRPDASYGAQWVWDYYTQRHLEKYGESFGPDTDPTWDVK